MREQCVRCALPGERCSGLDRGAAERLAGGEHLAEACREQFGIAAID